MAIRILTKNAVDNTNIDGARQNNFNAGGRSGIVLGALSGGDFISTASNVIALTACELIMSGHRIVIDDAVYFTLSNIPSEPTRYSLVAELIVDSEKVPAFELKIQAAETPLVQENLHADGSGRYELEIGRFTLTAQGITDLTQIADKIQGGTGDSGGSVKIGDVVTNTLDEGMDAEVDVDFNEESGGVDFVFNVPKGDTGAQGDMPEHQWDGSVLKFENPDGSYDEGVNLKGDKPAHQWDGTTLKLENPDGTFDSGVDLKGEKGDDGTVLQQEAIDALESDVEILIDEAISSVKESSFEASVLDIPNTGEGFLNDFDTSGTSEQSILATPNMHDVTRSTYAANCTRVLIDNGWRVTANDNTRSDFSYYAGWFLTDAISEENNLIYMPVGQYTISADVKLISVNTANRNKIKIYLRAQGIHVITGEEKTIPLDGTVVRVSQTHNVTVAKYYSPNFMINGNTVEITNIQVNAGTNTTWYAYNTPSAQTHAPSDINSTPAEFNVVSCGRNLLSLENETWTQNNVDSTYEKATGILTMNATEGYGKLDRPLPIEIPAGTYTIKVEYISGSTSGNVSIGVNSVHSTVNNGISCTLTSDNNYTAFFAVERETVQKYLVIYLWSSSQILNNFKIRLWLVKGSYTAETMPAYQSYNGAVYPYKLEAVDVISVADFATLTATVGELGKQYKTIDDGKLWEWAGGGYVPFALRSLPDGTADEVDWDNYLLQPYIGHRVITGTETINLYAHSGIGENYIGFTIKANLLNVKYYSGIENNFGRSNIGYIRGMYTTYTNSTTNLLMTPHSNGNLYCVLPKEMLSNIGYTVDVAGFTQMLQSLNNAGTPLEIEYKLDTPPEPIPIRKYGETYDGVVWDKNAPIPTQAGYTTVYTDASPQPILMAKEYNIAQRGDSVVLKDFAGNPLNPLVKYEDVLLPDGTFLPEKIDKMESDNSDNFATKIDKITLSESAPPQAYIALPNGAQGSKTITSEKTADSLALRDANSNIKVGSPVNDDDAVPKAWLVAQLQDPNFVNVLYNTLNNVFIDAVNLYSRIYFQSNSDGARWINIGNPNPFDTTNSNWSPLIIRVTSAAAEVGHYRFGRSSGSLEAPQNDDMGTSTSYTMYSTNSSVLTPGLDRIFTMGAPNDYGTSPMEPAVFYRTSSSQHTFKVVQKNYITGKEIVQNVTAESTSRNYYKIWVSCDCHIEVFVMPGRGRYISV